MKTEFKRYEIFSNEDGTTDQIPFVTISERDSDKYEKFKLGFTRFDKVALKYYGNETDDFFILQANPQFISEFDIEDGTVYRIPFPITKVKKEYNDKLKKLRER